MEIKHKINYEMMLLLTPTFSEEQAKGFMKSHEGFYSSHKAEITSQKSFGLRTLAYPIRKKNTAHYYYIEFSTSSDSNQDFISKLKAQLKIDQEIIFRYLVLKKKMPLKSLTEKISQ